MKTKTSTLTDAALDWAVAKCKGLMPWTFPGKPHVYVGYGGHKQAPRFSTDWSQGGPIIERERIQAHPHSGDNGWQATKISGANIWYEHGPTPLIAAMRCYVASKLGNEIAVPEELVC